MITMRSASRTASSRSWVGLPLAATVVFMAGFGLIGGQTAANAVAAAAYPTEIRATGVGWCLGIGRIGSIVGPLLAGVLIQSNVAVRDVFLLSAIPALLAALAISALPTDRRLEAAPTAA